MSLPHLESAPPLLDAWYLTGPTAAGKTEIGLALAESLSAEIISLDSMAVYRDMDIGTAKPNRQARERCPHHLLDLVEPTDEFSVSQYVAAAHSVAEEIRNRGRVPLFVGGTPLYLKTLLRGLYQGPAADWDFRNAVEKGKDAGLRALHLDVLSANSAVDFYRALGFQCLVESTAPVPLQHGIAMEMRMAIDFHQ